MLQTIKIILAYDGTRFFGWQKTPTGPSIEEELRQALTRILGSDIELAAASRTDRGVHAQGQVVHFQIERTIEPSRLLRSLKALLPKEFALQSVALVPSGFHATLDAKSKEYRYFLCNQTVQSPMNRLYSWHIPTPLERAKMQYAAHDLMGTHDFSAFSNERIDDSIRTLESLSIVPLENDRLCIEIRGDRFLYKMARNLVGTLVMIGCGKLSADCCLRLLQSRDRRQAGITAPAHGLFLWQVFY